ncbi:MAG: hypothetical protein WBD31_12420, partial [Rubripirellula sp.]
MIFVLGVILCAVAVFFLMTKPYYGILVALGATPIIAATWATRFGNVSLNHVIGTAVPLLIVPRLLSTPHTAEWRQWRIVASMFLFSAGLGSLALASAGKYFQSAETAIHALNGFAGFFLLAVFYRSQEGLKHVTYCLLLAGIFPTVMAIFQAATGVVWYERTAVGIARNVGLYHDAVSIKHFGLQTIIGIYLAFNYLRLRDWQRIALYGYAVLVLISVFNVYSKSALAILASWFLIWALCNRRFIGGAVIVAMTVGVNYMTNNYLLSSTLRIFWKEIAIRQGELDRRYMLAGRIGVWEELFARWEKETLIAQLIGTGKSIPAHNEFLRILITSGVVGLVAFLGVVVFVTLMLSSRVKTRNDPLCLAATFAFT